MLEKQILDLTCDLVKIPSVSTDLEQLQKIANFVEGYFREVPGALTKRYEQNGKPSIVVQNFEGKEADIMLNGHLDVVPASDDGQFEPVTKDGRLYARGAKDMKDGVAIMMILMKDLLEAWYSEKKVSLVLNTDEEVGGEDGLGLLTKKEGYKPKVALIPDGGALKQIITAEKGVLHIACEFTGKAGHASRPWMSDNAIDKMIAFYQELKVKLEDKEILYNTPEHWSPSVNLNVVQGGGATNAIPDQVVGKFDIRFTEKFSLQEVRNMVESLLEEYSGTITELTEGAVLFTDPNDEAIQKYLKIAQNVIGSDVILNKEHGASDGRYLAEVGTSVILHKTDGKHMHAPGEYTIIADFEKIYQVYEQFIKS